MKSPKKLKKITILKIGELIFFWDVKTYFGILLLKWCIFRHGKNWVSQILSCNTHCWKILLILVLGKVASKTQYSHFVICKVWVLGFTHHFTLHPLIWQIFSLISWLYFSTMWILWGQKCDYWVFHITHAKKGLPNHSSSTRDLKDFFSICDVENTILTYPPHSILSLHDIVERGTKSIGQYLHLKIDSH